jgi:hypothetical protein
MLKANMAAEDALTMLSNGVAAKPLRAAPIHGVVAALSHNGRISKLEDSKSKLPKPRPLIEIVTQM